MPAPKGNQYAKGNKGTEKMFKTPEELQKKVDAYFKKQDSFFKEELVGDRIVKVPMPRPYTVEGLALALKCDVDTLLNYEKKKGYEDYFGIIREAKLKIYNNWSERGLLNEFNSTIVKLMLINHVGYKDKKEVEEKSDQKVTIKWGGEE